MEGGGGFWRRQRGGGAPGGPVLTNKAKAFAGGLSIADLACQISIILRQLLHEFSC